MEEPPQRIADTKTLHCQRDSSPDSTRRRNSLDPLAHIKLSSARRANASAQNITVLVIGRADVDVAPGNRRLSPVRPESLRPASLTLEANALRSTLRVRIATDIERILVAHARNT